MSIIKCESRELAPKAHSLKSFIHVPVCGV